MMTWPRLRPATNDDRVQITDLVYTVLAEYRLKPDPEYTDADLREIEQSYFARGGAFCVLEEKDGSIVGSCGLYPLATDQPVAKERGPGALAVSGLQPTTSTDTCELRKMYLRRDYRGKGLGRMLLEDALARARELGFRRVTLETASVLKEAIRLYERYGFKPHTPDHLSHRCDQAYVLDLE